MTKEAARLRKLSALAKVLAGALVVMVFVAGIYATKKNGDRAVANHRAIERCAAAIEKLDDFRFRIEGKQHRCVPCSSECGTLERKLLDRVVEACRKKP